MQDELWEIISKLTDYKARRETSKLYLSVPDLLALDQEIDRLERRQTELMGGTGRGDEKASSRSDAMTAEIQEAQRELGDSSTPADIMRRLKRYAGTQGSCITETAADGVLWRTPDGDNTKLTMQALKKRLARRTQKGR